MQVKYPTCQNRKAAAPHSPPPQEEDRRKKKRDKGSDIEDRHYILSIHIYPSSYLYRLPSSIIMSSSTDDNKKKSSSRNARTRRSSIIEAHNIYVKYHQHFSSFDDFGINGDGDGDGDHGNDEADKTNAAKKASEDDAVGTKNEGEEDGGFSEGNSLYEDAIDDDPLAQPAKDQQTFPMFHRVEKTGVIYATKRASSYGYSATNPEWANMGQGAPETGPLEHAPKRSFNLSSK